MSPELPSPEDIDPIALANARAKGKRPYFFGDPDVERVLAIAMAIAMEHAVTRQRLDALERMLDARGLVSRAELDAFVPDPEAEAARGRWMQEYIARVLRIVHQGGADQGGRDQDADLPMQAVMDELRHS